MLSLSVDIFIIENFNLYLYTYSFVDTHLPKTHPVYSQKSFLVAFSSWGFKTFFVCFGVADGVVFNRLCQPDLGTVVES